MLSAKAQHLQDPLRKDSMDVAPVVQTMYPHSNSNTMERPRHALGGGRDGLRAMKSTRPPPSSRMTMKLLERKVTTHIEAINQRDFFEGGAVWLDKADFWTSEIAFLSDDSMDLSQYVNAWQKVSRIYPHYEIRCLEMATTVQDDTGIAKIVLKVEVSGMPVGIVRHNMAVASFAFLDGKWLATDFKTLAG